METVVMLLAGGSVVLLLWQYAVACWFPLHRRQGGVEIGGGREAVTVLKPLRGVEPGTAECLESWLRQDYAGSVRFLFGVESFDDPAVELVERLKEQHPGVDLHLVICPQPSVANPKVALLLQLECLVETEWLVIADADVRAPVDLLRETLPRLRTAEVGLVHCLYRWVASDEPASRAESLWVNADFWGQVLQARTLGRMQFALGAVMMTRRSVLRSVGGWSEIGDFLADDYELGHRIARAGWKVELATVVVDCLVTARLSWGDVWRRQLRWSRTIRFCQPWPYFFSLLGNSTLWVACWWASQSWGTPELGVVLSVLLLRVGLASDLLWRMDGGGQRRGGAAWWMPVIDLCRALLWLCAWLGRGVVWQDRRYRVISGGRMVRVEPALRDGEPPLGAPQDTPSPLGSID